MIFCEHNEEPALSRMWPRPRPRLRRDKDVPCDESGLQNLISYLLIALYPSYRVYNKKYKHLKIN